MHCHPGSRVIMTCRDGDPEPHHCHNMSQAGGDMAGLEGNRSLGRIFWGTGGVNAEFPGSGKLVAPSSLRAHTYM